MPELRNIPPWEYETAPLGSMSTLFLSSFTGFFHVPFELSRKDKVDENNSLTSDKSSELTLEKQEVMLIYSLHIWTTKQYMVCK